MQLYHTLTLSTTDLVDPNNTIMWWKSRLWDPSHGDQLSAGHNCSIHPVIKDRLLTCNQTLTLTNVTYTDAGTYRLRVRYNKTFSAYRFFNVTIFDTQPVLSIIDMRRVHVSLQCYDLRNPLASVTLEVQPLKGHESHTPRVDQTTNNSWKLVIPGLKYDKFIDQHGYWYFEGMARCCSHFHNQSSCSEWTRLSHNMYLDTPSARGRPWCYERNALAIKHIDFSYSHEGPLPDPTCYQTYYTTSRPLLAMCENVNSTVVFWYNKEGLAMKYRRPLGGSRLVAAGWKYNFIPRLNDSGAYYLSTNSHPFHNFTIAVLPTLRAAIKLQNLRKHYVDLQCEHNGRPHATVTWEVAGIYSSFNAHKEKLTLYADCWLNMDDWYYKVAVRCKVMDGPFTVHSRWFTGQAQRNNFFICKDQQGKEGISRCDDFGGFYTS